jgi:putative copper export protein
MIVDLVSALVRALSFIALFQAVGVVMFLAIFGRDLDVAVQPIRELGRVAAISGIVLVIGHLSLEAARMAGALSGIFDASLQLLVLDSPMSLAAALRIAGLIAILAALTRTGPLDGIRMQVGLGGTILIIGGFLCVGHTAIHPDRIWLAALLGVHLGVVAFWFGALVPLLTVTRREHGARATQIAERFSRIASWWVPGILVAGFLLTLMLVDRWAVFGESYGQLLLIKLAGFMILMLFAALNKWRYAPFIAMPAVAVAFQRAVKAEYVLICAVLTVTAIMTTFFSPDNDSP